MKRFIMKTGWMLMVIFLCLTVVNYLYVHTKYYKNLNEMQKFSDIPEHIDIVNFGASHSQNAFDWEAYDSFSGVNMALGAQTVVYDRALFQYYLDHLDDSSTIVLEVMFKSLYEREPEEPYGTDITRYYQILPRELIKHWTWKDALKFKYIPILGNRWEALSHIWSEWIEDGQEEEKDLLCEMLTGEPTQVLTGWEEDAMLAEANRRASVFMELSGNQEHGAQYEAFIDIIETCKENHIQVILVTAPTLPCFYEGFSEAFLDRFYADMEEICEKYDLLYLDYTGDERFLVDYRWYTDTDHLNAYGAAIFTQAFLQDVQNLLSFYGE